MSDKEKFNYKYSAPTNAERREIDGIRKQYLPKGEEDKLTRLRRLDNKVKSTALCVCLILGIGGLLIFGLGLTMILEWDLMIYGIIVMVVGAIPAGLSYPVHQKILINNKKKYGKEILQLSEELLNENDNK